MKSALMLRAHEAMNGAIGQDNLPTDLANAFMAEKKSGPPPTRPVSH